MGIPDSRGEKVAREEYPEIWTSTTRVYRGSGLRRSREALGRKK